MVALLLPLAVVAVPPLTDYPNHLARAYVLAFHASHPLLDRMFAPAWALIPNLALDLLLPPLMGILPPLAAGKVILALTALLPVSGAIALSHACFARRSLWQLGAGIVAYNALFLFGFINFQIALGVAFWAAAAWVRLSPGRPWSTLVLGVASAFLCFILHLFGFILFALLIGSHEAAAVLLRGLDNRADRRFAIVRGVLVVAAVLPTALIYLLSRFAQTSGLLVRHSPLHFLDLILPVMGYSVLLSSLVMAALAAVTLVWLRRGEWQVAPLAWVLIPTLVALYFILPFGAKGGFWIDSRVLVILGFLLFAVMAPKHVGRREGTLIAAGLGLLFFGRMAVITGIWLGSQQDVRDVRQVLADVPPGSRVLSVAADPFGTTGVHGHPSRAVASRVPQTWWHLGAFAIIDRDAYWPDMFAYPGQQPLVNRPPYDRLSSGLSRPPIDYRTLAPADHDLPESREPQLADWDRNYDFVLILNADTLPDLSRPLGQRLTPVAHQGFATLYRVVRP